MTPEEHRERIERRYRERLKLNDTTRAAQAAALDAAHHLRELDALQDRDRDFQAHGLSQSGEPTIKET